MSLPVRQLRAIPGWKVVDQACVGGGGFEERTGGALGRPHVFVVGGCGWVRQRKLKKWGSLLLQFRCDVPDIPPR